MNQNYSYREAYELARRDYFTRTYQTMAFGLLLTFGTALATARFLPWIAYNGMLVMLLCIAQIGLVFALNRAIQTAQYGTVMAMFAGYACLTGVTFSSLFLAFDVGAVFVCFAATAAAFGGMALYGHLTRRNLSPWAGSLMGGLIGLIVLGIVGAFLRLPMLDEFICALGIVLFMGLTAYDSQKLGQMYDAAGGGELAERYSVYAALQLYLDFLNIFLYLLRFLGNRRND